MRHANTVAVGQDSVGLRQASSKRIPGLESEYAAGFGDVERRVAGEECGRAARDGRLLAQRPEDRLTEQPGTPQQRQRDRPRSTSTDDGGDLVDELAHRNGTCVANQADLAGDLPRGYRCGELERLEQVADEQAMAATAPVARDREAPRSDGAKQLRRAATRRPVDLGRTQGDRRQAAAGSGTENRLLAGQLGALVGQARSAGRALVGWR